jgi:hypothetical protein
MVERINDEDKVDRIKRKFETVRSASNYQKKLNDVIPNDIRDNNWKK